VDWPGQTFIADIDGNGAPEVATSSSKNREISVWNNRGELILQGSSAKIVPFSDIRGGESDSHIEFISSRQSEIQFVRWSPEDGVEVIWTYDAGAPGGMKFANVDPSFLVVTFPFLGEVHGIDSVGTRLWKVSASVSTDCSGAADLTGDGVPDGFFIDGTDLVIIDGDTQETYTLSFSETIERTEPYAEDAVAVVTSDAIKIVDLEGNTEGETSINGSEVDAFTDGDIDGDGTKEIIIAINGQVRALHR
jgi:hypothetical protein